MCLGPQSSATAKVTRKTLVLPERAQLHSLAGATNRYDMLGPFPKPSDADETRFNMKHKEKARVYGSALIAAGGSVPGDPGEAALPSPTGNDMAPFNYQEMDRRTMSVAAPSSI